MFSWKKPTVPGLSSLPIPDGQPGPRQQGGVPPAVGRAQNDGGRSKGLWSMGGDV